MADPWNTTYAPTSSMWRRNAGDDSIAGLSPTGDRAMGAFGGGMQGAGTAMMSPHQRRSPLMMGTAGLQNGATPGGAFQPAADPAATAPPATPGSGGGGMPFGPFTGILPMMMGMGGGSGGGSGGGAGGMMGGAFGMLPGMLSGMFKK